MRIPQERFSYCQLQQRRISALESALWPHKATVPMNMRYLGNHLERFDLTFTKRQMQQHLARRRFPVSCVSGLSIITVFEPFAVQVNKAIEFRLIALLFPTSTCQALGCAIILPS